MRFCWILIFLTGCSSLPKSADSWLKNTNIKKGEMQFTSQSLWGGTTLSVKVEEFDTKVEGLNVVRSEAK